MIAGQYCSKIFSKQANEVIAFYREVVGIFFIKTGVEESKWVYPGFMQSAVTVGVWACKVLDALPRGHQSFVLQTDNLDLTMECLKKKGVALSEAIRYDWGTYEVRLNDIDGNEIVIVEFTK